MKQGMFNTILIVAAFLIGFAIFQFLLPEFIQKGGPLVVALLALSIMVVTYVFERLLSLRKAQGKAALEKFLAALIKHVSAGELDAAIAACDGQRGSLANIIKSGLERFREISSDKGMDGKDKMTEVQRVIEEATMLEMPILEKNLIALSTIASIATMVGLLGTVIGMIRAFAALAHAGSADAVQLSQGISEALINTAGGISIAIASIVSYNFFTTKIDGMTYMIDEASYDIIQNLKSKL
ncbi:MAG: MotA/TolQ/ExbB proton channel family protein [Bacteroidota bacterium]